MTIVPDDKDWTWVLEQPCPECGFDATSIAPTEIPALIRANAVRWAELLAADTARTRPRSDTWSALEYACHVRDMHAVYEGRLALMLGEDDPTFPNWDQDATAVAERYELQDPAIVATELTRAAESHAAAWEAVRDDEHRRTGLRDNGSTFTVESIGRYMIHDPIHHVADVERANA